MLLRPFVWTCLCLAACGGGDDDDTTGFTSAATATVPTAPTTPTSGATDVSTTDAADSEPQLDMASPETGCNAVDMLFVIDNSLSMGPYQQKLSAAFPSFVDLMFAQLPPGIDLHVGITTTSFFVGECLESTTPMCQSQSTTTVINQHYIEPTAENTGENGGQGRLFEWQGQTFFTADTSGDPGPLKEWFTGAATAAGEKGCSYEMPAAAAGWAADPANAATNAGFIRDEGAVLLVFVLSDEPDKSPEPVSVFVDKLIAAKQNCGGLDCILGAGLVSDKCYTSEFDQTLRTFLESFTEPPVTGPIDTDSEFDPEPDYTKTVGKALAQVIDQKCGEIAPVL